MNTTLFLEPIDILMLRGNKLFGDPGSYGHAQMPPWPSVFAGAIRSRMLADAGLDWNPRRRDRPVTHHPELGTPDAPGAFTLAACQLARRDRQGRIERLYTLPADLVVSSAGAQLLRPLALSSGIASSSELPLHPVLGEAQRSKPEGARWLTEAGWQEYLQGRPPTSEQLVPTGDLWQIDFRVGVGLDPAKRAAEEGKLFSVEAVALASKRNGRSHDVGFLVEVQGATPPVEGLLRFGGDGRACTIERDDTQVTTLDRGKLAQAGRLRLVQTTPGIYARGWLPTGADQSQRRSDGAIRFALNGVSGWIACAAVPRSEVISGFDLSRWEPKPAERVTPTGSVWWLELDAGVNAEALGKLVERGLWTDAEFRASTRRAEGYNRVSLAAWID